MLLVLIGWLLFAFGAVRLAVSAVNRFSNPYLEDPPPAFEGKGESVAADVSILIPARNEERNIGLLLKDLLESPGAVREILVCDDRSEDRTAQVVESFAAIDRRIRLVRGGDPPEGWLGKNHACFILAGQAAGRKLLFLDADVRVSRGAVAKAVYTMDDQHVSLLSLFPRQYMPTVGTRTAVPLMNWILLSLLPLIAVRKMPQPSLAAANGQFMLFDAEIYRRLQPHRLFRGSAVEDMSIVEDYKRRGLAVSTLLGNRDVKCRMYGSFAEAVNGFAKNVFRFFGGREWLAFGFAAVTTLAPVWIFLCNGWIAGALYAAMIVALRIFVSSASRQSAAWNLILIIPQQAVFWIILFKAHHTRKNKDLKWKGRNIYS